MRSPPSFTEHVPLPGGGGGEFTRGSWRDSSGRGSVLASQDVRVKAMQGSLAERAYALGETFDWHLPGPISHCSRGFHLPAHGPQARPVSSFPSPSSIPWSSKSSWEAHTLSCNSKTLRSPGKHVKIHGPCLEIFRFIMNEIGANI